MVHSPSFKAQFWAPGRRQGGTPNGLPVLGEQGLEGARLVVQSLCGLGLMGRGPLLSELGWGEFAMGGVGPVGVVVATPVFDDHAGFP